MPETENGRRPDPGLALKKDLARRARREPGTRAFWRSMAVLGNVGWPIVLGAVGGALLGRLLDSHFESGVRFTLILLTVGLVLGCTIAWRSIGGPRT